MLLFKKKPSLKIAYVASAFSILTACGLPQPKKPLDTENTSSASFVISSNEVRFTQTETYQTISLPKAKVVSFKSCLKDFKTNQPTANQKFKIADLFSERIVLSDRMGCVNWSQQIDYNHLADSAFVTFPVKISGQGRQIGSRLENFILNPWEDLAALEETFKNQEAVSAKSSVNRLQMTSTRALNLEELRLTIEEKQISNQGTKLNLEFRTSPSVQVKRINQPSTLESINFGSFTLDLMLIHVLVDSKGESRRLLAPQISQELQMTNGSLYAHLPINLSKVCTRGQVNVGVRLRAKENIPGLQPFEGVFTVSECENIKGSFFARLKSFVPEQNGSFKLSEYVTSKEIPNVEATEEFYEKSRVEIRRLQFANVGYRNHHTINRDRLFNIQACLKTGLDQKITRAQNFRVIKANGEVEEIRSNDDGCIMWDDSIKFNFFERECWLERSVEISNTSLGLKERIPLKINPWSFTETFVRDGRFLDTAGKQENCAQGKSHIIAQRYDYDKRQISYELDKYLNLKMVKEGVFRMTLRLKRPSLTEPSGYAEDPLPVGGYLLKYAIVDNAVTDFSKANEQIYQVAEKVVYINANSTIAETISLSSRNIKAVGNTNNILIEVLPLKESAIQRLRNDPNLRPADFVDLPEGLESGTFVGPIILANNTEGSTLEPVQGPHSGNIIDRLTEQLRVADQKYQTRMTKMSQKNFFSTDANSEVIDLHDINANARFRMLFNWPTIDRMSERQKEGKQPINNSDLLEWLDKGQMSPQIAHRICAYYFFHHLGKPRAKATNGALLDNLPTSFQWTSRCQNAVKNNKFKDFFAVQYKYFIKNPKLIEFSSGNYKDVTFSTAFGLNKGVQESLTKSISWDASVGMKLLDFKFISASTGSRFSVQKSWANNQGSQSSNSIQQGVTAVLEQLRIKFEVPEYEKCAVITLNPNHYVGEKSWLVYSMNPVLSHAERAQILMQPIMLCEGRSLARKKTFEEDYFVLNQRMNVTQVLDPNTEVNRPFFTAIRGESQMRGFLAFLHAQVKLPSTATSGSNEDSILSEDLEAQFNQSNTTYPGQLIRSN